MCWKAVFIIVRDTDTRVRRSRVNDPILALRFSSTTSNTNRSSKIRAPTPAAMPGTTLDDAVVAASEDFTVAGCTVLLDLSASGKTGPEPGPLWLPVMWLRGVSETILDAIDVAVVLVSTTDEFTLDVVIIVFAECVVAVADTVFSPLCD